MLFRNREPLTLYAVSQRVVRLQWKWAFASWCSPKSGRPRYLVGWKMTVPEQIMTMHNDSTCETLEQTLNLLNLGELQLTTVAVSLIPEDHSRTEKKVWRYSVSQDLITTKFEATNHFVKGSTDILEMLLKDQTLKIFRKTAIQGFRGFLDGFLTQDICYGQHRFDSIHSHHKLLLVHDCHFWTIATAICRNGQKNAREWGCKEP